MNPGVQKLESSAKRDIPLIQAGETFPKGPGILSAPI